ncbi:hypothetical protein G6321_00049330 [Bradyrhizobium barranii subsp. barranii]|uniref:Uncharacterized protein n=1 Tax=Bradyrhizobium barranii subsp. barranii TaxID=2823807 RepID=A0A7Z0TQW3_9BRAD|nr:hypothetical protein [Bradyrhizobium barranii]UGX93514.1 hypothetical protein G6321_00049330 [Bradyrhizobium barranii subsp. barranii]
MEKAEFIRKAPGYYVAGIGYALEGILSYPLTREKLNERVGVTLGNDVLFDAAIRTLSRLGVIEVLTDTFAPTLYKASEKFDNWWSSDEATEQFPLIGRLHSLFPDDREGFIRAALSSVNSAAWQLSPKLEDFETGPPDEWEPIPIDRHDPAFQEMERTLEVALDEIAGSNGYASSAPEERNYVVAQLTRLRDALKTEAHIQWMMIKTFGIEPLAIPAKRYGKGAIGIAAKAASQAIQEWLKKVATKVIEWFFS